MRLSTENELAADAMVGATHAAYAGRFAELVACTNARNRSLRERGSPHDSTYDDPAINARLREAEAGMAVARESLEDAEAAATRARRRQVAEQAKRRARMLRVAVKVAQEQGI